MGEVGGVKEDLATSAAVVGERRGGVPLYEVRVEVVRLHTTSCWESVDIRLSSTHLQ